MVSLATVSLTSFRRDAQLTMMICRVVLAAYPLRDRIATLVLHMHS